MRSELVLTDKESVNAIPVIISNNPREQVDAEYIDLENILSSGDNHKPLICDVLSRTYSQIKPIYPLELVYNTTILRFDIDDITLIHKLRVWNASSRSIYIQYCGLWNERSRLGASWCCYPRTRFLLAPGLNTDFYIKATPKEYSPVQSACMNIQLAAAHLRDHVVAYYAIPIQVNFLKYVMVGEDE